MGFLTPDPPTPAPPPPPPPVPPAAHPATIASPEAQAAGEAARRRAAAQGPMGGTNLQQPGTGATGGPVSTGKAKLLGDTE